MPGPDTDAAAGKLALHEPPASALLKVIVSPAHIGVFPVIAAGLVVMVITVVAIQAVLIV